MRTKEKLKKQIQNETEILEHIEIKSSLWKLGMISTAEFINELNKIKNSLEKIKQIEDVLIFNNVKKSLD